MVMLGWAMENLVALKDHSTADWVQCKLGACDNRQDHTEPNVWKTHLTDC